jgi:hypothetical protein
MGKLVPSAANVKQLGWAAVGVVAGFVLYNTLTRLAGNSFAGKVLSGEVVRRG